MENTLKVLYFFTFLLMHKEPAPLMDKKVIKIGITGSTGTGKSLVCKTLERYHVSVFDANRILTNVLTGNLSPKMIDNAINLYGDDVCDKTGKFNAKKASLFFHSGYRNDPFTDDYLYSRVRDEFKKFLYTPIGGAIRAVEYSLILETKSEHLFDEIWCISCDEDFQKERLMSRDDMSEFEAEEYIRQGLPQEAKIELCKRTLDNSGDRFKTEQQTMTALSDCKRKLVHSDRLG
jgi:dephospho-CoA kinase